MTSLGRPLLFQKTLDLCSTVRPSKHTRRPHPHPTIMGLAQSGNNTFLHPFSHKGIINPHTALRTPPPPPLLSFPLTRCGLDWTGVFFFFSGEGGSGPGTTARQRGTEVMSCIAYRTISGCGFRALKSNGESKCS